jgi:outer membrane protein assembly factor BamB
MLTIDRSADHGNAPGILYAFDAETLAELWNSEENASRDRLGTLVKFVPPTVAGGKVYAATYDNRVIVYGVQASPR